MSTELELISKEKCEELKLKKYLITDDIKLKENCFKYPDDIEKESFDQYRKVFENKNTELIEFIFKYNDYKDKSYGVYFAFILENIIKDFQNIPKIKYDAEKTFSLILEIFRDLFRKQFEDYFTEFLNTQKGSK